MPFPIRVLYIEDDAQTRELARFFLEEYFLELRVAKDGEEALEIFLEDPEFDLVISDLLLPGFDGFEVLRRMRKRKEDLAVIIFSAYAETQQLLDAIEFSVDGYLLKPFDPDRFDKVISACVGRLLRIKEERNYREELQRRALQLEAECNALRDRLEKGEEKP